MRRCLGFAETCIQSVKGVDVIGARDGLSDGWIRRVGRELASDTCVGSGKSGPQCGFAG